MEVHITDNSKLFIDAKNEAVRRALEAIGLTAERHAKEQCPVDTGLLRNSITHAVSGEKPAIDSYHASYGSERYKSGKNAGKRRSASSKYAGSVGYGKYSGTVPNDPPEDLGVYIGTNVEYARKQELGDSYKHSSGSAHFLRDSLTTHDEEYRRIALKNLKGS